MSGKLRDIRETASDAIEIIHEIGTPEVRSSLDKIKDTTKEVREIIQALSTPEMVKNMENMRLTAESMQDAASRMENTFKELKESGVLDEVKKTSESARNVMDSFGSAAGGNNSEVMQASKETVQAVKELVQELKLAISDSRKSGVIKNVNETVKEISSLKDTVT
ncbi:hypothetical protein NTE_01121 [Candidatus Nitrososphaera evergladensis SR1]|jgi:methyl-accepting chemotaxis protein|uniref:Uncharacterized protein n=1 Tax=Candidatus Nitrososphaera evergladensis SR1 TaxID=1459636 RepID=A0A075MV93_9ARCH|nr:hypothetical protein [Candidatus Nitrososphaera evergladensis]AIF83194.1 hypothetical protein NTE_01121 [Candidatus Nitrososphaera evergladensis SR1]